VALPLSACNFNPRCCPGSFTHPCTIAVTSQLFHPAPVPTVTLSTAVPLRSAGTPFAPYTAHDVLSSAFRQVA